MAIRMTGLMSGLDTESLVGALMSAKRVKQTKIEDKKQKLEWKQEIWSALNTKLYSFTTGSLSKMRLQGTYKTKSASTSDASMIKATAGSGAATGSYSIKVMQLASAQYVTSGKLSNVTVDGKEQAPTGKTKLKDLGIGADGSTQITVKAGEKVSTLTINEDTTINDFVSACKTAGLNASYDEKQQRFFISSQASGKEGSFSITTGTLTEAQQTAADDLKAAINYDNLSGTNKTTADSIFTALQYGTMTDATAKAKLQKLSDAGVKTAATDYYKKEIENDLNSKYFTMVDSLDQDGNPILDEDGNVVQKKQLTDEGRKVLEEQKLDKDTYTDDDRVAVLEKYVTKTVKSTVANDEYKEKIADAVTNGLAGVCEDATTRSLNIDNAMTTYKTEMSSVSTAPAGALKNLGLADVDGSALAEADSATGMVVVEAADSVVEYNGVTLTSSDTNISIGGLNLELLGTTGDKSVTVSVTNDQSGVYDTVKDFLSEYNALLKEMNTKYSASSARGYNVLTDEEREAMTDDQIEKWEDKIKDSLLRRDDTLSGLINTLRSNTSATYTASNGKTYSLASLGITTSTDYSEGGLLHIKGDEDDTEFKDETNKLEQLLQDDPEIVTEVLSGLFDNLYSDMQEKMSSTRLSSALTFYNDKEMKNQITDYQEEISKWEDKLADMEERYYAQFTAMEKAMANMQSQQTALAGLLGTS